MNARDSVESLFEAEEFAALEAKYEALGVKLVLNEYRTQIVLASIKVPEQKRNEGIGSAFMRDLVDYADKVGKPVFLSPSGPIARLRRFYGQFGFVRNLGRNKDFLSRESMVRQPRASGTRVPST